MLLSRLPDVRPLVLSAKQRGGDYPGNSDKESNYSGLKHTGCLCPDWAFVLQLPV